MFEKVFPHLWMHVKRPVRMHLIKVFAIPGPSGITEVVDQTVVSDGYKQDDLNAITLEKMMQYIGQDEPLSFSRMWELTVQKAEFELNPIKPEEIGTTRSEKTIPQKKSTVPSGEVKGDKTL